MRALARAVPAIAIAVSIGLAGCSSSSSGPKSACGGPPPLASAGTGQTVAKHTVVQLQGSAAGTSGSASYLWQLIAVPAGSAVALSASADGRATFTADVAGVYVASLTITDACAASAPDKVVVVAANSVPLAVAGPNQTVQPGDTVALDGAASGDADRDPLSFQWSLVTRPYGSAAQLASATQARATFVADVPGTYLALLVVSDGAATSALATTVIQAGGPAPGCSGVLPVASAGPDQTLSYWTTATLSGAGSRSGGGGPLTYRWSLVTVPAQSQATLNTATGMSASLSLDRTGVYLVSLVVNDGCADSAPATVKVTRLDQAPTSYAYGATIPHHVPFTLQGGAWDPDGDSLTYQWTLVSRPPGSSAALSSTTILQPTFTPDLEGQYVFSLVASDGTLSSPVSTMTLTAENQPPVARVGADQAAPLGATVTLDGSASSDPNQTPLTFTWTVLSPHKSPVALSNPGSATPSFVADVAGVYVATLVVSDGVKSATAKVNVSAWPAVTRLGHRVVDADYSAALDKILLVSNDPAALYLHDPRTHDEIPVLLTATPTSVSVSPNGLFAAVGHLNAVSYVDLTKAAATVVPVNGNAAEVALADDGYAYAFSAGTDNRIRVFAVSTATGAETDAISDLTGLPSARFRPGAPSLYVAGGYSSAVERYDVSAHVPVLASISSSSSYGCGGGLWFTAAGDRVITRCGTVLRASISPVDDLTYFGTLAASSYAWMYLRHAADSTAAGEISCIATSDSSYSSNDDRTLRRYAADGLALREMALFPVETLAGSPYHWYGRFVFYRSDGSERYVVMQLDQAAAAVQDFGIATY
jgi:chitinase